MSIFTIEEAEGHYQFSNRLMKVLKTALPANRPVIDFGCCKGEYLEQLSNMGMKCFGYEGTPEINTVSRFAGITTHDITKPLKNIKGAALPSGSVICLDVIGHIEKKHEKALLKNISSRCKSRLIISWAEESDDRKLPNKRDLRYVISTFEKLGFELNMGLSQKMRTEAGFDFDIFQKSIYVFDKA